jgi:hypothetical protein
MNVALFNVRERVSRTREQLVACRLQRFAWRHREAVSKLAQRHSRLADLALSFPALLFALAVPRRGFDSAAAIRLVIHGARLKELAAAADLPLWTRWLMPETFLGPIPWLPDGENFRRQIANHLPTSPTHAHHWLRAVSSTGRWGHEQLAVWYARRMRAGGGQSWPLRSWEAIALWTWHCAHAEAPASHYLRSRWSPEMSLAEAATAALDWCHTVEAGLHMGFRPLEHVWADPATCDGYVFRPVRTAEELAERARALENCGRGYAYSIAANTCRIWIAWKDDKAAAMLSLVASDDWPYPTLEQIRVRGNGFAPPDLLKAAHSWAKSCVHQQQIIFRPVDDFPDQRWRSVWRDYWLEKCSIPEWLPLRPTLGKWRALTGMPERRRYRPRRRR